MKKCAIGGCEKRAESRGWCGTHYMRWVRTGSPETVRRVVGLPEVDRFWQYVNKTETCWLWTGGLSHGYGNFMATVEGRPRQVGAHRYSYELLRGPIPDGLQLDHLCRVPACVNPAHLEPVTQRENVLRGDTARALRENKCIHGHAYTPENTTINSRGARLCRTCMRAYGARYRAARKTSR